MSKHLGTFVFPANFQMKIAEAIDPRVVANCKEDLIDKNNWTSDGSTYYVYRGLIVDCGNDGVYRLVDPTKLLNEDYSGWEKLGQGLNTWE